VISREGMDEAAIEHFRQVALEYDTVDKATDVLVDSELPAPGGRYWCRCFNNSPMMVVIFTPDGRCNRTVGNFIVEE